MRSKTYYFIDYGINPDSIYGDGYPVCLDEAEVQRLSREWGVDLFEQMHEARNVVISIEWLDSDQFS